MYRLVIFISAVLLWPSVAAAQPALVVSASTQGTNGGTTSAINTTGCNLIVASVSTNTNTGSFTSSPSNTWIPTPFSGSTSAGGQQFYYCLNPTTSSSMTFSYSAASSFSVVFALGFSWSNNFKYQSANGGYKLTTTSFTPGALAASNSAGLFVTGCDLAASLSSTCDSSFITTYITKYGGGGTPPASGVGYLVASNTTAINPTWSTTASQSVIAPMLLYFAQADPSGTYITSDGTLTGISKCTITGGTANTVTVSGGTAISCIAASVGVASWAGSDIRNTVSSGTVGVTYIIPNYYPPPTSTYFGSAGLSGTVVGTISGAYNGGNAITIDGSNILSGIAVPSGTSSKTGGLVLSASSQLVINSADSASGTLFTGTNPFPLSVLTTASTANIGGTIYSGSATLPPVGGVLSASFSGLSGLSGLARWGSGGTSSVGLLNIVAFNGSTAPMDGLTNSGGSLIVPGIGSVTSTTGPQWSGFNSSYGTIGTITGSYSSGSTFTLATSSVLSSVSSFPNGGGVASGGLTLAGSSLLNLISSSSATGSLYTGSNLSGLNITTGGSINLAGTVISGQYLTTNLSAGSVHSGVFFGIGSTGTDVGATFNSTPGSNNVANGVTWMYLNNSFTGSLSTSSTGNTNPGGSAVALGTTYSFNGTTITGSNVGAGFNTDPGETLVVTGSTYNILNVSKIGKYYPHWVYYAATAVTGLGVGVGGMAARRKLKKTV